jgi:alpha-L-fucosidase
MKKYTGLACVLLASAAFVICPTITKASHLKHPAPVKKSRKHAIVETSKMAWWSKARFGMFIHWGVYSVPAGVYQGKEVPSLGEWIMHNAKIPVDVYQAYAKDFNPVEYDPERWVTAAERAGMKYIVITTKHHDGFAMFDSKASDWNIVQRTPYGKDVIKQLAEACRKHGMKLGFYYSQANDWNNPGGAAAGGHWDKKQDGSFDDYIDRVAIPQIKEILNNYGDVAELWWDVPTDMTPARAAKFLPLLKDHPNLITNDRLGGGVQGDLSTPEQYIPPTGYPNGRYWEACMTMNDTWGFKTNDHNWKSSKTLIRNLIDIASKGGNYLLNVGPQSNGLLPDPILSILGEMGKWTSVNGEAIYGTTASPFRVLPWGRCTTKELENGNSILYLHVFNWPANGQLLVPGLENTVISAKLLANGNVLKSKKVIDGVSVSVPITALDDNATVIKLEIKGKPKVAPYMQSAEADGSFILSPLMADLHNPAGKGVAVEGRNEANLGYWIDPTSTVSWQLNVKKPGTYAIEANVGSPEDTNAVTISSGDQSVKANIKSTGMTGKNVNYQKVSLGEIKLDKKGITTLTITPVAQGWKYINLRSITLKPVN